MSTFIFAMKQYLHRSHANVHLCHVNTSFMPTFIFVIKLPRHFICIEVTSTLHPCWNCDNIHLCHETMSTLHLCRSRDNIYEATSKLHLYKSHANIHEAMSTLHIAIEATSTLYLSKLSQHPSSSLKLRQHFIRRSCDNIHETTSKLHLHRSHANIHEAMSTLHLAIEAMSTLYSLKLCQRSFLS